jgi:hypothetical protein
VIEAQPPEPEAVVELAARELTQRLAASFSAAPLLCRISPTVWLLLLGLDDDDAAVELHEGMRNVSAWPLSLQGGALPVTLRWAGQNLAQSTSIDLRSRLERVSAQLLDAPWGVLSTSKR